MSRIPLPDEALPDAVTDLWGRILSLAGGLAPDDWDRPTPCPDWTVRHLLGHLSGVQVGFDGTATDSPAPESAPPAGRAELEDWVAARAAERQGWTPEAVRAELEAAARGHVQRVRAVDDWQQPAAGPLGPTTEAGLARMRCFDLWVHLQDLRAALALPVEDHDPSPAALTTYGYVVGVVPWLLAKRVRAPEGTALRLVLEPPAGVDTVLALRDGRGGFHPDAEPEHGVVEADPAAFVLLLCGRGDAESWRADGLLRWQGDGADALLQRGRIFAA